MRFNNIRFSLTLGFFCCLAWPFIVFFNCVILAQVMELFVPSSGISIMIPYIGEYEPLSLVLALIIAASEVVFAMAAWLVPNLGIRIVGITAAVIAIGFEAWGAMIRQQTFGGLETFNAASSGVLSSQTAGVAAFIGFLAPTAEMLASIIAHHGFVQPLQMVFLRLPRIAVIWVLRGIYLFLFGFLLKPIIVLDPEIVKADEQSQALIETIKDVRHRSRRLREDVTRHQEDITTLIEQKGTVAGRVDPEHVYQEFDKQLTHTLEEVISKRGVPSFHSSLNPRRRREHLKRLQRDLKNQRRELAHHHIDVQRNADVCKHALAEMQTGNWAITGSSAILPWGKLKEQHRALIHRQDEMITQIGDTARIRGVILTSLGQTLTNPALLELEAFSRADNLRIACLAAMRLGLKDAIGDGFCVLLSEVKSNTVNVKRNDLCNLQDFTVPSILELMDECRRSLDDIKRDLDEVNKALYGKRDQQRCVKSRIACAHCHTCSNYIRQIDESYRRFDNTFRDHHNRLTDRLEVVSAQLRRYSLLNRLYERLQLRLDRILPLPGDLQDPDDGASLILDEIDSPEKSIW